VSIRSENFDVFPGPVDAFDAFPGCVAIERENRIEISDGGPVHADAASTMDVIMP
jgi:hypothetical protein